MLAATGPWVAARLHHLSGDFAAAWQWQLAGLVLMSLLVLRLDPRYYPRAMRQSSNETTAPLTRDNPSA